MSEEIDNTIPVATQIVETKEDDIEEYDDMEDTTITIVESESENNSELKNLKFSGGCWFNENLIPVTKIKCIIPYKLLVSIKNIEKLVNKKLNGSNEFSIFIHGEFNDEGEWVVSEDFYIPKQTVSGASVEYHEEPDAYYNGCLHKHPDGCKNFSGTDRTYINSNFEFSLLYVCKKIELGIINIVYFNNRRLQVPVTISIVDDEIQEQIDIENINKTKPVVVSFDEYTPCVTPPTVGTTTNGIGVNSDEDSDEISFLPPEWASML